MRGTAAINNSVAKEIPFMFHVLKTRNTCDESQSPSMRYFLWYHSLNLGGSLQSLLLLNGAHLGLGAHDATAPLFSALFVLLHEAILDGRDELGQLSLVF